MQHEAVSAADQTPHRLSTDNRSACTNVRNAKFWFIFCGHKEGKEKKKKKNPQEEKKKVAPFATSSLVSRCMEVGVYPILKWRTEVVSVTYLQQQSKVAVQHIV